MERKVSETIDPDDEEDELGELQDKVELIVYTITKYEKQFKAILAAQEKTINMLMRAVKADSKNIDRLIKNQKNIVKFLK